MRETFAYNILRPWLERQQSAGPVGPSAARLDTEMSHTLSNNSNPGSSGEGNTHTHTHTRARTHTCTHIGRCRAPNVDLMTKAFFSVKEEDGEKKGKGSGLI